MTPRPVRRATLFFVAIMVAIVSNVAQPAHAQASLSSAPAPAPTSAAALRAPIPAPPQHAEAGVRWQSLTVAQRGALAPLEHEWPRIDPARKQKWLTIAGRFGTLPPQERARISQRMTEWTRLTPSERGEARLRYQEARQVPAHDRTARWDAYQKLPAGEKQQFAARAASSRAAAPAFTPRRDADGRDLSHAKVNVVPNPALAQPPRPVAPTVVQASRGATTHLITRLSAPPAHQHTGMPKIAATPEFVNRSTLLPRRGPQAAAITPVGASTKPHLSTPTVPRQVASPAPVKTSEPSPPR